MKTIQRMGSRMSLRFKWTLAIFISGVLFLTGLAFSLYSGFGRMVLEETSRDLYFSAVSVSRNFQDSFNQLKKELVLSVSDNPRLAAALKNSDSSAAGLPDHVFREKMKSLDAQWPQKSYEEMVRDYFNPEVMGIIGELHNYLALSFLEITVTDARGVLAAATGKTADYYQADEVWWQKAFNGGAGSLYRSEIKLDKNSEVTSLVLATPIYDLQGAVVGVLRGVADKERAFYGMFRPFLNRGNHMGIMRADGMNVIAIHSGAVKKQDYAPVVKNLVQRDGRRELSLVSMPDGRKLIGSVFKLEGGLLGSDNVFYVYFLKEYNEAMAPLRGIMGGLVFLWLGMMVLFLFVSVVLVNRFLAPIGELRKGFSFLKRGLLDQRISIKSGDEFEVLARDFNAMVEELRGNMVSKDHFNQIIQNMSDILFVVDGRGAIDLINRRACEMLEYGENELKGIPAIQILAKKDRYIISWGLKGLIDEGALRDKKISLLSKSGREIEVYLGTRSLRDMANSLVGLVCLAKDLTEINKLMEALRRSNEEILKNKKELEASLKELMSSRDIMLSVLEDTNESKLALEATLKRLRETQDQLLQAEKMVSLGQIAAGVAHEINNPLFVISGEAEMMGFEENIPQSLKDSIKTIREQVHRISDIIKRMLEFSRKKEAKFVAVEIDPLLQKSIDLLQYQVKVMGNIDIIKEFAAGTAKVNGDINQLTEVFINLMINAIQSMEVQGGTLTVRSFSEIIKPSHLKIGSPLKIDDHVICIQVADTGTGISEETMRKIFDPFFTTKKTGTGLGLSVCFGIIETHGGTIEVTSTPGEGTTFTVFLPVLTTS